MTQSTRDRVLLGAVVCLAIYFGAPALLPRSGIGDVLRRVLGHPFFLLGLGAALGLVIVLARRGCTRWAVLAAVACGLVGAGYGLRRMRIWFPHNVLLSPAAYAKAARLLLGEDILLGDYSPRPTLVVARPVVSRAKYPVIDVHFHFASLNPRITPERLVAAMDSVGVRTIVNLDGMPDTLEYFSRVFAARYPGRFINFATLQQWSVDRPTYVQDQTAWLEKAIGLGARGIKVWKAFGLQFRDSTGALLRIDDPRFDFIWDFAGRVGLPVLMHNADPAPFWQPTDRFNERYEELRGHPDWTFSGPEFPPRDTLFAERERLLRRHPHTVFIGAHVGNNAGDLQYAAHLLDTYPNYYVDISSRLSDLGRQPRAAREFFIRYQDRILFGSDGGFALDSTNWSIERFYRTHFEFLETGAEYFDYPLAEITQQGSWKIYGISLPDSVLAKIYAGNAERLIPSSDEVRARLRSLQARRVVAAEPPDAACHGRTYHWARSDGARPTPMGSDSAEVAGADFAGDSVKLTSYSFRPGGPSEIVANGLVRNDSRSPIELRGYRVEYLSPAGAVLGSSACRVRMGYEHCGLASTNLRLPGYVALSADTLPPAPPGARVDTARVFWTYCSPP